MIKREQKPVPYLENGEEKNIPTRGCMDMQSEMQDLKSSFRRIRCMHGPRFVYYDKKSKTRLVIDTDLGGNPINLAWEPNKYPKDKICPSTDEVEGMSFEEVAQMGLQAARLGAEDKSYLYVHYGGVKTW